MSLSRADIEFYHARRVRQLCLELSRCNEAVWDALSYRTKQKWMDRAVDQAHTELLAIASN